MLTSLAAYVLKKCDKINGKKAFQKIFYFITEAGIPTGLSYTIYHYGPYSAQLDFNTDNLEIEGAISISTQGIAYKIYKGIHAERLAEQADIEEYVQKIDGILEVLPIDNPLQLELLSTTHYISKVQKNIYNHLDQDQVVAEVKKIKKNKFTEEKIEEAYTFLYNHGLMN